MTIDDVQAIDTESRELIVNKTDQNFFVEAEFYRFSVDLYGMGTLINLNTATFKDFLIIHSASSKKRINSRHKYLGTERFGNIIIHTKVKTHYLIVFISLGGKHDYRDFGFLTDLAAYLPAVHLRHHNIQNDKCHILICIETVDRFFAITRFDHLIALHFKKIADQFTHSAFIIYNKYFYFSHILFLA